MFTETKDVRNAARQLVRELNLLDTKHCIEGFTFSECHLITELEVMGQATASELSEVLVLEKSTVSRLCDGLVKGGFVIVKNDASDRRRKLLRLSGKGKTGAKRIHKVAREQVNSALTFVPESERSILAGGLDRYRADRRYLPPSRRPARVSPSTRARAIEARTDRDRRLEEGRLPRGPRRQPQAQPDRPPHGSPHGDCRSPEAQPRQFSVPSLSSPPLHTYRRPVLLTRARP